MTRTELLLIQLMEECAEVSQRASKALRFGLMERQPEQKYTNEDRLKYEIRDFCAVVDLLERDGVILVSNNAFVLEETKSHIEQKKEKVEKFLAYSKELGILKS